MSQPSYQERVDLWMNDCFTPDVCLDRDERNLRFYEESTETIQANGANARQAHMTVDYVFGRPTGVVFKEVGGALVALSALCTTAGVDMTAAGEAELDRVNGMKDKLRAKQPTRQRTPPPPGGYDGKTQILPGSYLAMETSMAAATVLARYGLVATASQAEALDVICEDPAFRWFSWFEAVVAPAEPISAADVTDQPAWTGSFSAMLARFGRSEPGPVEICPEFVDPFARGVHKYWRGAAGPHDWDMFKADMPGQVAMFRKTAMRVAAHRVMAGWQAAAGGDFPEASIRDMALALYESWRDCPRTEPWTPILERCFLAKARAAADELSLAGIGLRHIPT